MDSTPLVSIGLPVYNGENYLEEAIQSILQQTYTNFELIICDNASTDRTSDICKHYSHIDSRITYYRNSENTGAARNFNRTFQLSKGKYFKWSAHDDLIDPRFLEYAVDVLEKRSDVVLCSSLITIRDEFRHIDSPYHIIFTESEHKKPFIRFRETLDKKNHACFDVFGLYRKSVLSKTPLIQDYIGSDRVLISLTTLMGKIHILNGYYCLFRDHKDRSIKIKNPYKLIKWYNPQKMGRIYGYLRYYWHQFLMSIRYADTLTLKIKCSQYVILKAIVNYKDFLIELSAYHPTIDKARILFCSIKNHKSNNYEKSIINRR